VLPKESGRIEKLTVDVGSRVKAGDVIAQLEHTTQDLSVEQARAQLQTAQAHLDTIKAGPRPENVRQSEINLDTAESRLKAMQDGPRAETVAQARLQVDAAQQKLNTIQAGGRAETVAQAQATLSQAQARLQALKNGLRPEGQAPLELAVSQAKNALYAAQLTRDGNCNPAYPKYMCDAANAQVNAAQTAVDQAMANLRAQTAAPTQTDVQQAQAAVDQAQAALNLAQKPYTDQDLKSAQDALAQAQQQLALSAKPYTAQDLRQAQDAVDLAEQQLALAKQPYTKEDLETAQAGVAQAQAGVDQAVQAVKDATVVAPIDGVVTEKDLNTGALASPTQPIVAIAGSGVKVEIPVEEAQVVNLKLGMPAALTGPPLGDKSISAKVTNIAPTGDPKNRTFAVDLTPTDNTSALLPGMFVTVILNAVQHAGVLAVPSQAVVERAGTFYVYVVANNVVRQVPVTVGLSDGKLTEVSGNLEAGQSVVVSGQDQLADGDHVTIVK
jgi:RND family efflux transporter MFP subunit